MYGIPKMYCLNNLRDMEIQGDFYSEFFSYLEIRLFKCSNSTSYARCKSENEINNFLLGEKFSLALINSYFDYIDFTPRIHGEEVYS